MYEVERKARIAHEDVRNAIADIDAEYVGTVRQRDTYFDHPTRDFAREDEALRVRRERVLEGSLEVSDRMTYKGPRLESSAKTRIEQETDIADAEAMVTILGQLDFVPAGVVEKTRERYRARTCEICLDSVEGLGEFVEIEAAGSSHDLGSAEAAIAKVVDALGIHDTESITESYLGMVLSNRHSSNDSA